MFKNGPCLLNRLLFVNNDWLTNLIDLSINGGFLQKILEKNESCFVVNYSTQTALRSLFEKMLESHYIEREFRIAIGFCCFTQIFK